MVLVGEHLPLAVTTAGRLEALLHVPTVGQLVPGYEASALAGVRHQPAGRHLELRGAPLDSGGLVGGLNSAKSNGFGGQLVDGPARRLRRFGLACHARSIGRELCRFNSG
jgi:hypothetical protein